MWGFASRDDANSTCGGRVLDLVVCEVCGEVFFGGYRAIREIGGTSITVLTPDMPDLEALPDAADPGRPHTRQIRDVLAVEGVARLASA